MITTTISEFANLVKKMRAAQQEQEILSTRLMYKRENKYKITDEDFINVARATDAVVDLESMVDEWLEEYDTED